MRTRRVSHVAVWRWWSLQKAGCTLALLAGLSTREILCTNLMKAAVLGVSSIVTLMLHPVGWFAYPAGFVPD